VRNVDSDTDIVIAIALQGSPMQCLPLDEPPRAIVRRHLAKPSNGWSVGTYGAIGEFQYDAAEPGLEIDFDALTVRTLRGALAIVDLDGVQPFALVDETGRTREIAFCSPRLGAQRTTITALDERTFDVGVGALHIDMLVRVRPDDAETAAVLQGAVGRSLFASDHPAGAAIARANPARILVSGVARLEVDQPIPLPGGRSPEGPHTHLLPEYLKEGRPHPPGSPLPAGLYCGLSLYPRTRL
jgi:hypothetical protein